MAEQPLLDGQPAAVAPERAVVPEDPVAGHDDGHRVVVQRVAGGAGGPGRPRPDGHLRVGGHAARGDLRGRVQHPAVEGRQIAQVHREIEVEPLAGEVAVQGPTHVVQLGGLDERHVAMLGEQPLEELVLALHVAQDLEPARSRRQAEDADGGIVHHRVAQRLAAASGQLAERAPDDPLDRLPLVCRGAAHGSLTFSLSRLVA